MYVSSISFLSPDTRSSHILSVQCMRRTIFLVYCIYFVTGRKTRLYSSIAILYIFPYYLWVDPPQNIHRVYKVRTCVHFYYFSFLYWNNNNKNNQKEDFDKDFFQFALASALQSCWKLKLNQEIWSDCWKVGCGWNKKK